MSSAHPRTAPIPPNRLRLAIGLSLAAFGMPSLAAPPDRPGALRVAVYSNTAAELFWSRSSDADGAVRGYEVLVDDRRIGQFDALSYFTDELVPGREYRVQVVAIDNDGERSAGATARFVAGERGLSGAPAGGDAGGEDDDDEEDSVAGIPPAPADARMSVYSRSAAELFWARVPGSTQVRVLRDEVLLGETDGTSYYDDTRMADRDYSYQLIAVNAAGRASRATVVAAEGAPRPPAPVTPPTGPTPPPVPTSGDVFPADPTDIAPDGSLYATDGYAEANVVRMDLRTLPQTGPCTADDLSGCTLDDVLADTDKNDDLKVDIPVHFQADDFADDGTPSNAEMRQRGGGARFAPQKSFRIKLDSKKDLWRDERYVQLNKHPFESSRFRNKVAFDLMQGVPHLPSFRTQFVNLWIDDGAGPVDNGLYTHVERLNDDWLKRRDLPGDGNLYSAEDFRFAASDLADVAIDAEGEPLDKDRFESSLEIEEGKDHRALVAMLSAVQDPDLDFETVLDRHFNRNNVLAWITFNLLVKQDDATRHNYKLYNPAGTERFYLIPWDYDAVFGDWEQPPAGYSTAALQERLDFGYALGHRNDFVERYYRMPGVHERVLAAVAELRGGALSDTAIQERSDRYNALVAPFLTRSPDLAFNPEFNGSSGRSFASNVAANEAAITSSFSIPLPPTLLEPVQRGNRLRVSWTPALDVTGNPLTYDLEIASSAGFEADSVVLSLTGIADAGGTVTRAIDLDRLRTGTHYARLTARVSSDPSRYWQVARNRVTVGGVERIGMIAFEAP